MNPKPFASLNHFTLPVAMSVPILVSRSREAVPSPARGHDDQGREFDCHYRRRFGAAKKGGSIHCLNILRAQRNTLCFRREIYFARQSPRCDYSALMFDAAGPFWPCVTSKETFWPSLSDL